MSGVAKRALLVAGDGERREVAVGVGNAGSEIGDGRALLDAGALVGLVVALRVGVALGDGTEDRARGTAEVVRDHPHAARVGVAGGLVGVAVLADRLARADARTFLDLDLAKRGFFGAATEVGLDVAVGAADEVGAVPEAAGIVVA